ncbi:hypothetical protein PROFUN_09530 [Planoprotostelium fungivorum]|uniref:GPI transamidase component PIG-T n=1 Tax=Planoprotostelium fungivorum TaxID=1890364 RepID=A0A2P6MT07_9EUKA|nr:hypothetical protein PROFUN_09530 [Planoprotostelium fungivorum]
MTQWWNCTSAPFASLGLPNRTQEVSIQCKIVNAVHHEGSTEVERVTYLDGQRDPIARTMIQCKGSSRVDQQLELFCSSVSREAIKRHADDEVDQALKSHEMRWLIFVLFLTWSSAHGDTISREDFTEQLRLKPLPDSKLLATFDFTFTSPWPKNQSGTIIECYRRNCGIEEHYRLVPKSMIRIIKDYTVNELHLSFTQGRWSTSRWGRPLSSAPPGSELWVYFFPSSNSSFNERVDDLWSGVSTTLSGLYCASLGQLKKGSTCSPRETFSPEGHLLSQRRELLRYGVLPREGVCTENLTPWLKQLPCSSSAGMGALLKPTRLYDTHWHSMSVNIRRIYHPEEKTFTLELRQSLSVVMDRKSSDWTLNSLFGVNEVKGCPLARESRLIAHTYPESLKIRPLPTYNISDNIHVWVLKSNVSTTLRGKSSRVNDEGEGDRDVDVRRYLTGHGLEYGGIASEMTNVRDEPVEITYLDMLPWSVVILGSFPHLFRFLRLYFHTLRLTINGIPVEDPTKEVGTTNMIEFKMILPPRSTTLVTVQYEKAFLHWTEHPPDANRGFDLGSAVITVHSASPYRFYSDCLLLSLPTPDFSMPYNVVTLTGTVFALFFGATYNLLIRRGGKGKEDNEYVSNRPIARIIRMVLSFIDTTPQQGDTSKE